MIQNGKTVTKENLFLLFRKVMRKKLEFILSYAVHQLFHMGLMDCVELARAGGLCVGLLLDLDRLLKKRKTHYYE